MTRKKKNQARYTSSISGLQTKRIQSGIDFYQHPRKKEREGRHFRLENLRSGWNPGILSRRRQGIGTTETVMWTLVKSFTPSLEVFLSHILMAAFPWIYCSDWHSTKANSTSQKTLGIWEIALFLLLSKVVGDRWVQQYLNTAKSPGMPRTRTNH